MFFRGGKLVIGINGVILIVCALILIIIIFYIIMLFNSFIRLKNDIDKSFANIDVLLKQRFDELPNLMETVKGYMKHEKELFLEIAKARNSFMNATTMTEKARSSNMITETLKSLFAVSENYPKLRANENFLKLQERITGLENEIADRREFYNDAVTIFNTKLESFPDMFMGRMMNLTKREWFKATEEEKNVVSAKI